MVGARVTTRRRNELEVLLRHERASQKPRVLEALLEHRSAGGPDAVRVAADRLLREHARWALDLAKPAALLVEAAGRERDQRLFISWSLHPDGRTFDDLAKQEGMCRQNVNGLVRRAESRVRAALETSPAPLPWVVATLRCRLGTAATEDQVAVELARLAAGKPPVGELITWLAGPYSPVPGRPGWVATEPKQLVARTAACLAADGGVRRLLDVETELADLGVHADRLRPWLRAGGATVVHDVVVSMSGSLADVIERVLDAHGQERTAEEIAVDLGSGNRVEAPAALASALHAAPFHPFPHRNRRPGRLGSRKTPGSTSARDHQWRPRHRQGPGPSQGAGERRPSGPRAIVALGARRL